MNAIIGVDVGYGFVKAAREDGRSVVFPSAVAVAADAAGDLGRALGAAGTRHRVSLAGGGGRREDGRFLVGEAALVVGAARTWDAHAAGRRDYGALVLTAARLLGVSGDVDLAVGLPLALYLRRDERLALRDRLAALGAWVSLDGDDAALINVRRVTVAPQAAGAFFAALESDPGLAERPCGLIDLGYRTCDHLLMRRSGGGLAPDESASGSFDAGAGLIVESVRHLLAERSGVLVPEGAVEDAQANYRGRLYLRGEEYDVRPLVDAEAKRLAARVADEMRRAWSDRLDLLGAVLVAGGGGELIYPHLRALHPLTRLVPNPLTANAAGFLAMARSVSLV